MEGRNRQRLTQRDEGIRVAWEGARSRYLNLSELAYVRHRAAELMRRRRPRRAGRVRSYAVNSRIHTEERPPVVPSPRRPLDSVPLLILQMLLAGLRRLGVAV